MVSAGTIEERMYQRQIYKQQLHNISVHGQYEKRWFKGVQVMFCVLITHMNIHTHTHTHTMLIHMAEPAEAHSYIGAL